MRKRELGEIPGAPPALMLMLREFAPDADWSGTRRRIRAIIPDLRQQSSTFDSQNVTRSESPSSTALEIHLHGALDLLSGHGCVALECRVEAAKRLARSVGLIADRVWLTDHLSTEVMSLGRVTNADLDRLMHHAISLAPLLPLIEAGIVRFRSPWIATCKRCTQEFENQVEATTAAVLKVFRRDFKVESRGDGGFFVMTGKVFDPPVVFHSANANVGCIPSNREYAADAIAQEVRQILWTAREAAMTRGSIFTNSRPALAGLLERDGRLPDRRSLLLYDRDRALDVPWVSELNAAQILQLREEAALALPAFRERLARSLVRTDAEAESKTTDDVIADLREQAAEVRAELTVKRGKSARYWKTTYGVLGLALSAYGVATDQVLPSVGGLLPVLQLLISHKMGHEADLQRLTSRPGYVLVRAQDILQHVH